MLLGMDETTSQSSTEHQKKGYLGDFECGIIESDALQQQKTTPAATPIS